MLLHYLRASVANLRLRKQTTLINIVGLTLGLCCFVLAYAISAHLASADQQFTNAERIFIVQQKNLAPGDDTAKPFMTSASPGLAQYLRTDLPELEAVARRTNSTLRVDARNGTFGLDVTFADPDFLRIFDFSFVAGDGETALGEPTGAVITARMADLLFGTRDALGEVFSVSRQAGRPFDVVVRGVVEESSGLTTVGFPSKRFGILLNIRVREAMPDPERLPAPPTAGRNDWRIDDLEGATYVMLPSDGSLSAGELGRRLAALGERIVPASGETVAFRARTPSSYFNDQITAILAVLGIVTGIQAAQLFFLPGLVILAMACFNYVNLSVAIAATRAKEVGMRKVLGASVRQVVQQHLFEAVATVLVAFASAFVLAALLMGVINTALGLTIPFLGSLSLGFWMASVAIVIGTGVVAGAYPSWVMSRFQPLESLRVGAKRSGSSLLRSIFIGTQFAVASVLLTAVLVMYAQNGAGVQAEMDSLSSDPIVQIDNNLLETPDVDPEVLTAALLASPSIRAVTGMADGFWSAGIESESYSRSATGAEVPVSLRSRFVSYEFFSALGIDLLAGRDFARDRDVAQRRAVPGQGGTYGIVIERETARLLGWSNPQDAVGETIYQSAGRGARLSAATSLAFEVIGVVDKAPLQGLSIGLANIYRLDPSNSRLLLRLAPNDVSAAMAHIASVWERLVPQTRLRNVRFLDQTIEDLMLEATVMTTALLGIVAFGFLVALAGIFGMALFVASRRRHEIGIRKSLGAGTREILHQLLVEFGRPVLVGNVIAWPLAYLLSQLYVSLWLERASLTAWPYLLSLVLTLGLAWLGIGGQALRAARLHPARVLRYE